MIELYTAPTPNGHKVSIMLEEVGLPYTVRPVDLGRNEQKSPEFLALNPNGRIPVIMDRDNGDYVMFESGAILMYLAEKSGQLMPSAQKDRYRVIQWLMFQMAGVGPMMGQANVWFRYYPQKVQPAIDRYQHEARRLLGVLDSRLAGRDYLCDEYSIADIANWCWAAGYGWSGLSIDGLDHLAAWIDRIAARPAVQRGRKVPPPPSREDALAAGQSIIVR